MAYQEALHKMKRDLSIELKRWVASSRRKPLILRGARQVGKSWFIRELGKEFKYFIEINFERHPVISDFFQGNLDVKEITKNISNYFKIKIIPGETLLFFDEIQECPRAITALRYYYEDMPELHVVSAGSLLEFELRKISIPVGRVNFIYVYPLSFGEFLTASGNDSLRKMLLENGLNKIPNPFHEKLLKEVRDYTLTGGMPEVVDSFIKEGHFEDCLNIQTDILQTFRSDFNKYARKSQIKYLDQVFSSIPLQLGSKFKYSKITNDIKSVFFREALDLLEMAGIVYRVYHSSSNGIPLGAEVDNSKFKVLFFDVGLAQRLMNLDYRNFILKPDIFQINNGTIAELFTGLELVAYSNYREKANLHYWHREARSSNAEVDYTITLNSHIVPVEVKSGTTGRMKSLKIFMESKKSKLGIKISEYPFSLDQSIQSIPFYGIESLIKSASDRETRPWGFYSRSLHRQNNDRKK
jgi:predicted AAA+ superfamily ATPase